MSTLKDLTGHTLGIEESWQRERPDLDLGDFLLSIYIMRLGRILDDAADKICRQRFGISGADMRVLYALRRAGKPYLRRPTALFKALLVTSGAMTKQVDRLEGLGLVERLPGPRKDGGVQLTAKGFKVVNAATDILAKQPPIKAGVVNLSASQRAAGERFIRDILQALEAAEGEAPGSTPAPKRAPAKRRART